MIFWLLVFALGFVCGMRWQGRRSSRPVSPASEVRDVTDAEIEELLRHGHKLEAIRRYREIHRCDIATAQSRVELLEAILRR